MPSLDACTVRTPNEPGAGGPATAWRPAVVCRFLALIAMLGAAGASVAAAAPETCRVGTYAYAEFDRSGALKPLADWLQTQGGCDWKIEVFDSPGALAVAMGDGKLEWALPNLTGHLRALQRAPALHARIRVAVPAEDAVRYRSLLLARAGTLTDLAELKSRAQQMRLGFTFADSASGGLVPATLLAQAGLDAHHDFAELRYSGRHDASLRLLLAGELDVIGLPADLLPPEHADAVVVLAESAPIPVGAMLCGGRIAERCEALAEALLAELRADRMVRALAAAWPEFGDATRFEPAPAQDYAALLASLPQEPAQ